MKFVVGLLALVVFALPAYAQTITPAPFTNLTIYQSGASASVTGTTSETNLAAIKIPAGLMGVNGSVRVTCLWTYTNSANTKTMLVRFNATSGATSGGQIVALTQTTQATAQTQIIIRNANSLSSQVTYPAIQGATPYGTTTSGLTVSSVDTSSDSYININATLANSSETITLAGYTIEVMHP